jgi:hypothetical protein
MRKLGAQPLTGAEKQRRHRERVKARLAEAERLKILLVPGPGQGVRDLPAIYDHILNELGATHEEREALRAEVEGNPVGIAGGAGSSRAQRSRTFSRQAAQAERQPAIAS